MRVFFDAWLEQGEPRLRIVEAETGQVRLNWRYRRLTDPATETAPCDCAARLALHQLLRDMFLLSCADRQRFAFNRPQQSCLSCDHCLRSTRSDESAANDESVT